MMLAGLAVEATVGCEVTATPLMPWDLARSCSSASWRPATITLYPASTSATLMARPMPLVPLVTSASIVVALLPCSRTRVTRSSVSCSSSFLPHAGLSRFPGADLRFFVSPRSGRAFPRWGYKPSSGVWHSQAPAPSGTSAGPASGPCLFLGMLSSRHEQGCRHAR